MTIRSEPLSKCAKCRYYCRAGATFLFSHIGLCGLVFGYTVMGAFTFKGLEEKNEIAKRIEMQEEQENVVKRLEWMLTSAGPVLNESEWSENATMLLKNFEITLVKAMRKEGYDGNNETSPPQWSFSGSLFYSIIVITTIGYGNITTKTDTGKIVTILYAIVGIPLLLLCLSNIGDAMANSFKFIYWKVCCYLCKSPTTHRKRHRSSFRSRYAAEVRSQMASPQDLTAVAKPMYGVGTSDYGRRQNFPTAPTISGPPAVLQQQQQTPYVFSAHELREGFADARKVPIISNKYVLGDLGDCRQHPLRSPYLQGNASRGPTSFAPFPDDVDFEEDSISEDDTQEEEQDNDDVSVPIMLCIAIVVGYICGGAILFSYWEGWEYFDSCYFCFITLTTIGFGDMVPGNAVLSEDAQLALGLCSLYVLFGMALIAMSFNLVQAEVNKTVKSIGRRIGILSSNDDDDDES